MLGGADEQDLFSLSVLRQHFGLETPDVTWDMALDRMADEDRAYASALINRGVNIFQKPKIKLSTIHGAKGGEADNVVLFTDITAAAEASMEQDPDSMHRVFYVAVTRTRQNLYTIEPQNFYRSYAL